MLHLTRPTGQGGTRRQAPNQTHSLGGRPGGPFFQRVGKARKGQKAQVADQVPLPQEKKADQHTSSVGRQNAKAILRNCTRLCAVSVLSSCNDGSRRVACVCFHATNGAEHSAQLVS